MTDLKPPRRYKTPYHVRKHCRERRVRNRLAERCINDTVIPSHGPPTHGSRCDDCHETHKRRW